MSTSRLQKSWHLWVAITLLFATVVRADERPVVQVAQGLARVPGVTPPVAAGTPTLNIVVTSASEFLDDLRTILVLGGEPTTRFETLSSTLDTFLTGVDRKKPISMRGYLVNNDAKLILSLPINSLNTNPKKSPDLKSFLSTAKSLDVTSKALPGSKNVYELYEFGKLFEGFGRYDYTYLHIGKKDALPIVMTVDSPSGASPGADIAVLLNGGSQTPAARKSAFGTLKKELVVVTKNKGESEIDFQIRKLSTEQQAAELERFFVDSSKIEAQWQLSSQKKNASLNLSIAPLAKTDLATSVELLGQTPDRFAGIDSEGTSLTASINFPIDTLRKAHLQAMVALCRQKSKQEIDADKERSAEHKKLDGELSEMFHDLAIDIGNLGIFNGFLRMYPNASGIYTSVGGMRLGDTKKVNDIIAKFTERIGKDRVKIVDAVGTIQIHSLQLTNKQRQYPELFAADGLAFVGVSDTEVWYAAGENALPKLKEAITKAAVEMKSNKVLDIHASLGLWVKLYDRNRSGVGDPTLRKTILDGLAAGADVLHMSIEVNEGVALAKLQLDEGILRVAGKVLGKFVKESLE